MSTWRYVSDSVQGTDREENKDRVWTVQTDNFLLAVLFDGISSAKEANQGIDIAVNFLEQNHSRLSFDGNYTLPDLMFDINKKIVESGLESPYSTYSAVNLFADIGKARFSNLGDSRIYEVTPQYLKQLSEDDNLVHSKNVVTKYLGMLNLERGQVVDFSLDIEGKRILLCSDGFYSMLEKKLSRFYEILNFKTQANVKKSLSDEIDGVNFDDSSYVLVFE